MPTCKELCQTLAPRTGIEPDNSATRRRHYKPTAQHMCHRKHCRGRRQAGRLWLGLLAVYSALQLWSRSFQKCPTLRPLETGGCFPGEDALSRGLTGWVVGLCQELGAGSWGTARPSWAAQSRAGSPQPGRGAGRLQLCESTSENKGRAE